MTSDQEASPLEKTPHPNSASSSADGAGRASAGRSPAIDYSAPTGKPVGGVIAVTVTPCRGVGVVDPPALGSLSRNLSLAGCDGIFIVGSTGKSTLLNESARRRLTAAAVEAVRPETAVYVGVSGLGLRETIQNAHNAADDGADFAVAMVPFFFKFTQPEVIGYLTAMADASPIPVTLYHHPAASTPMSVETIAHLAGQSNIVAVKYTSSEVNEMKSLLAALPDPSFPVLPGCENIVQPCYEAGATGGMVAALAGVAPEWHVDLYRALQAGDRRAATEAQRRIDLLCGVFREESVQQSISAFSYSLKVALKRRGWLERLDPLMAGFTPDDALKQAVTKHLDRAGFPRGADSRSADGMMRVDPPTGIEPTPHSDRIRVAE